MKKPENITNNDWRLLKQKYRNLDRILKKIEENYPVQYLIGYVEFLDNKIIVNKNVLIPRFETETLVKKTSQYIKKLKLEEASVLELGTGSGCISIALKSEFPSLGITATDISSKALKVAKRNAKLNKVKFHLIKKNMSKSNFVNKYDVLISNPPYIRETDEIDPKTKHEPKIAIYAGKDGFKYYEQIFKIAKKSLNSKYLIALEIDEEQGKELKKLAKEYFSKANIKIEKDLAGKDRYLFIMNK